MIINPYVFSVATPSARCTYVDSHTVTATSSEYSTTFSSKTLGPASAKRVWVMVCWRGPYSTTMNSMTIAGVSATRYRRWVTSSYSSNIELWAAETPSATGDVVCTFGQHSITATVGIFYSDTSYATNNYDAPAAATSTSRIAYVDAYDGGFIIAAAHWISTGRTTTWTGVDEVYDATGVNSFGMISDTTAESNRLVRSTISSSSSGLVLMAVSIL